MSVAAAGFMSMTVAQLKEELLERKLPLSGPKPRLRQRLHAAILNELRKSESESEGGT